MSEKFCPRCFERFGAEPTHCPTCKIRLVSALDRDLTGQVLDDRYEILEPLGKGGMGVVYRAKQRIIDRPVALKVLRRELVQDEASVKRFMVEAKAVSALRSPHTITLYDFGITQEGLLYFTMELMVGKVLTNLIQKQAPFAPERAVAITLQVCDSLREAHAKGILHRDLKPDNIFIIAGGDGGEHAKVLDFGIAKMLDDGTSESITKTGMICGTPMYLSPEQAVGHQLDARSDIYSLGIILYEMLAGSPPFVDATPVGVLMKQVSEKPMPVSVRNPKVKVPAGVERVLSRVLGKKPDERPPSIDALMKELKGSLQEAGEVLIPSLTATQHGVQLPGAAASLTEAYGADSEAVEELRDFRSAKALPERQPDGKDGATIEVELLDEPARPPAKRWLALVAGGVAVLAAAVVGLLFVVGGDKGGGNGQGVAPQEQAEKVPTAGEAQPAGRAVVQESLRAESEALRKQQEALEAAVREAEARNREMAEREAELKAKEAALAQAAEEGRAKAMAEAEAARKAAEEAKAAAEEAERVRLAAEEERKKAEAEEAAKAAEQQASGEKKEEERKAQLAAEKKRREEAERKRQEEAGKAEEERRRKEAEQKKQQEKKKKDGLQFEEI